MTFQEAFPVWNKLHSGQQDLILSNLRFQTVKKGTMLHNGDAECSGLLLVKSGQLRAYILSDEGREITLYRLFDRDLCLFSASCIMRYIQFEVSIEAEKDTDLWVIPAAVYQRIMEQVMWKSLDTRVAAFLLEEAAIEGTSELKLTHETIANHLGTHREVITRMLRYFQSEGMVKLSRGAVAILDERKLEALRE